jgi:hypothetical protein
MVDDNDVSMAEPDGAGDAHEQHSSGYDVGDTVGAVASDDALGAALDVQGEVGATHPEVVGARAETFSEDIPPVDSSDAAEDAVYSSAEGGYPTASDAPNDLVSIEMLLMRATIMFTSSAEAPIKSGHAGLGCATTVELCTLVKKAIATLFEQRRAETCRSPERSDLQLSQEEASGYLLVDVVRGNIELVVPEPRQIGKRVEEKAGAEKRAHENAKEKAKTKRKNARTAAGKDEAKAATLDATLAAIDADVAAKQTERLAKPVDLKLPDPRSAVVDGPAPVHWRHRPQREEDSEEPLPETVEEAEEALAQMLADVDAANAAAEAYQLAAERASKSLGRLPGSGRDERAWLVYTLDPRISAAEQKRRDEQYERYKAGVRKLKLATINMQFSERKVESCKREAKVMMVWLRQLRKRDSRPEEARKRVALELHARHCRFEVDTTKARMAGLQAHIAQMQARLAELDAQDAEPAPVEGVPVTEALETVEGVGA